MSSRRESRSAATELNTLQEFENLRKTFKASNDRLAKKNNELLAQISLLNKQLQDSASENFQLRGEISNLQRNAGLHQAKALAFERERQTMLDLIDEVNRATEWSKKNLASLRRSFELVDNSNTTTPPVDPKPLTTRQLAPTVAGVSRPPDMSRITEGGSDVHESPRRSPHLSGTRLEPSQLSSRVTSIAVPKARDSLSLTWSGTPVVSSISSASRRGRPSGLIPLDPMAGMRSSPPAEEPAPETSLMNQRLRSLTEFNPVLSPVQLPVETDTIPSSVASRGKEREKARRRPTADWEIASESGLNDVTNSSPPPSRRTSKSASKEQIPNHMSIDVKIEPPTPVVERRMKKMPIPSPSLTEDILTHGSSDMTTKSIRSSLAPTRASRSASPIPDPISGDEGRERRVRKSVNYTEPKLNTKMRKPEGWDATNKIGSRTSLAATTSAASGSSSPPPHSIEASSIQKRRATSHTSSSPLDEDEDFASARRPPASRSRKSNPDGAESDKQYIAPTKSTEEDRQGRLHETTKLSIKPLSKGKKRALSHDEPVPPLPPLPSSIPLLSDRADSLSAITIARKRKTPSYSSSARVVPSSDDEDERELDGDDEYVEGNRDTIPKGLSSRKRSSTSAAKRSVPSIS